MVRWKEYLILVRDEHWLYFTGLVIESTQNTESTGSFSYIFMNFQILNILFKSYIYIHIYMWIKKILYLISM